MNAHTIQCWKQKNHGVVTLETHFGKVEMCVNQQVFMIGCH